MVFLNLSLDMEHKDSQRFVSINGNCAVELRGAELVVNGTSYGGVKPGDAITVDHGRVLINDRAATATGRSNTPASVSPPN